MASTEPPLTFKKSSSVAVVVLRVSIHCEGCKRKVKKLLQSLPGVDDIQIERLQQRVVVTGDVTPQTLITKLVKSGKNAELWPQKPPESSVSGKEIKSEIPAPDPSKVTTTNVPSDGVTARKGSEKVQVEVQVEEKKPEPASPTTVVENENNHAVVGGGEGKKKNKVQSSSSKSRGNIGETSPSGPPQDIGSGPMPTSIHSIQTLPRHNYMPPPAPVYTLSYNTPHPPENSHTTYAPSPPPQSYAYSQYGSEMLPPPQSYGYSQFGYDMAPPPSVPSGFESSSVDSFEMFSDENPNGCLVM